MQTLKHQSVLVVGGSRGLGLGVVEALAERDANITIIARDSACLTDLKARLGVSVIAGDATDASLAESAIREVRPSVLVLNAGATPVMSPLHKQTWESFSRNWETDVKATFHWVQAALNVPVPRGSRVLMSSSGAAIAGSPLSGSYAGAKLTIWLMADANGVAKRSGPRHSIPGPGRGTDCRINRARPRRGRSLCPQERRDHRGVPRGVRQAARPAGLRRPHSGIADQPEIRERTGVCYPGRNRDRGACRVGKTDFLSIRFTHARLAKVRYRRVV